MRARTAYLGVVVAAVSVVASAPLAVSSTAGARTGPSTGSSAGGAAPVAAAPRTRPLADGFDFAQPDVVATGLAIPWGMTFLPDGSALVAERNSARIVQVRPGSPPQELGTVPGVAAAGEGGLLGLAVSPQHSQDGLVYAYLTAGSDNRIVRFRLGGTITPELVLGGIPKANIHNGGRIHFGPDGMLYAGTGDAANTGNAQDPQSLGGKILRMTPDGQVPPDNPTGSLMHSNGHRNVQGFSWDGQGQMYATEFGQNTWDEVNHIVGGGNYGWPEVEGRGGEPTFRDPLAVWSTAEASPSGAAISGGTLYAAALRGQRLWQVPLNGEPPAPALQGAYGRLRSVAVGPDGWLWIATSNRDGRGDPAPEDDRVIRFPPVSRGS